MRIGVFGAGAVGCYLGGRLAAAGHAVTLLGRPALVEEAADGLRLTDYAGADLRVRARVVTTPEALAEADAVLVTTKSRDTAVAGAELARVLPDGAVVASFQNGVRNAAVLREALPGRRVLAGMVPFNVVRRPGAHVHQGTSGVLVIEQTPDAAEATLLAALVSAGLPARACADMTGILWGKLLLNLNNPVNALAGVPLREQLGDRDLRRVVAACMREGLAVVRRAGIRPRFDLALPLGLIPTLLSLPTPVFRLGARAMLRIDPEARSSMWEDLERGRPTEIEALNGEIVALGRRVGVPTPVNVAVVARVRAAEGHGSPKLSGRALRRELGV